MVRCGGTGKAEVRDQLSMRFEVLLPHLNERQRRLLLATEARLLGHGGVRAVAEVAGVSETTVRTGVFELEAGEARSRRGRYDAAAADARAPRSWTATWSRRCWRWWSRMSEATRSRRCGGRPSHCGIWPVSWAGRDTGYRLPRWAGCCGTTVQPARQRQGLGGRAAPGPGCAVPVHQPAGRRPSDGWRPPRRPGR